MKELHLVSTADHAYYPGLRVAFGSVARYANKDFLLHFYFLDGGIKQDEFDELETILKREHPHTTLERIRILPEMVEGCPKWKGSVMGFTLLLLPRCLPSVDFCIYFDSDLLWTRDITELEQLRDPRFFLQGVRDGCAETEAKEKAWFEQYGFPFSAEKYICFGVVLMELATFRREKLETATLRLARHSPPVLFATQSVMNALFLPQIRVLDPSWQRFSWVIEPQHLANPFVIHYAGDTPWKRGWWAQLITDPVLLWYRMTDSLLGVEPGTTLKHDFSWWRRVYKRGLVRLMYHPIGRTFFYLVCRLSGRSGYCNEFNKYVRDLKIESTFERLGI